MNDILDENAKWEGEIKDSPLYSKDLAPTPKEERTWTAWNLATLWVGMAVCIPTYMLASSMIISGFSWIEAIMIVALGNLIITLPMMLTGHAGVKYGIPFPVVGRAAFGTVGIHIASLVRGIVACGWFGIQTWLGGLAFYAIGCALTGATPNADLDLGKFIGFGLFWLMNVYFIWKGTESIRWLEEWAAPILIGMGLVLIGWGWYQAGGFGVVLQQSQQLETPTAVISTSPKADWDLSLNPIRDKDGQVKASEYRLSGQNEWTQIPSQLDFIPITGEAPTTVQFRMDISDTKEPQFIESSVVTVQEDKGPISMGSRLWQYLTWLTVMVGFWGTMAISIADITRYTKTQKDQVMGQLIGLPGTMVLYSFVGIFVTCAAVINFGDILVGEDAPWDPVQLLSRFDSVSVVIIAQIFMLIATLSTNIAANVIAPANAFSNLLPKQLSFRGGGIVTAIIGIIICPWWLLGNIIGILLFVSGLLGPVLGILIADYFWVRKTELQLEELYKVDGAHKGISIPALVALLVGVAVVLAGFYIPALSFIYQISWFSGFFVSFVVYGLLQPKPKVA
ncbi:MAG: NCS1 family nucleobase:cation symporter-1 [Aureispira sp.]|nr:NCS1 family nucleobase:cation symporter-1 [Aureispira sp.]